jgi:hypothetical protein
VNTENKVLAIAIRKSQMTNGDGCSCVVAQVVRFQGQYILSIGDGANAVLGSGFDFRVVSEEALARAVELGISMSAVYVALQGLSQVVADSEANEVGSE